ncbi:CynX/NimT family MFS transporter [Aliiglaciecola lipolytica]|uniref:Inner membrane transport protein yeaN n=1 Tax=Aliiglaciecola lipolytica E3 TaxID=1127673 RepID=K6Y735_9ALTE|nr:MFS transporter [Aliiglaciecola lipolytica]GAC14032.1 inner membrane transport protein yeaN [Aliiglaciecola lipolytica E3]
MFKQKQSRAVWILICVLLVALNLRLSLAGVGPLINDIALTFKLSNALLGLLTTLPLILFAGFSFASSTLITRIGLRHALITAMAVLSIGIIVRSLNFEISLFIGSALIGLAIAIGNVSLPAITKERFAERAGKITGAYSATMSIGAALGAGLSVPMAHTLDLNWQLTLCLASIFSVIALIVCACKLHLQAEPELPSPSLATKSSLWQSGLSWQVAIFMGCQSFTFYVILAWLPTVLIDRGMTAAQSGWLLAVVQFTGIAGALLVPILAGRKGNQLLIVVLLCTLESASLMGLLIAGNSWMIWLCGLIGFVLGGTFSLSLMLIVLRASSAVVASQLSGFAQAIGYTIAALGPFLFGYIHDITHSWHPSLMMLFIVLLIKFVSGLGAGQARTV